MKIKRIVNGTEYEFKLTEHELFLAFEEQEHIFDLGDIESYFSNYDDDDFKDEFGLTRAEVMSKADEMAYAMRRDIVKYGVDMEFARDNAVSKVLFNLQ